MCPTDLPSPADGNAEQAAGGHAPEVSVIIPAKDLESYIDDAIKSVLEQDFRDFELIVVDDGSTDRTQAKVRSWMKRDPRILLLGNIHSPGVSGARNTGLDAAQGTFLAFLDGDDTWYPGSLAARVVTLKSMRPGNFVHGVLDLVDEALVPLGPVIGARRSISFDDTSGNPASLNACLIPRSLIGEFRFNEDLDSGEDWLFIAQILRTGAVSRFVPEGGGTYRVRPDSKVNSDPLSHERALEPILDWVFGPETDSRFHPDYREGIRGHNRRKVVGRRKFRALGDALIMRSEREAAGLLKDIMERDLVTAADIKPGDLLGVSLARHFRVPADQIRTLALPIREEMAKVITSIGAHHVAPDFIESLWSSIFSENWKEMERTLPHSGDARV